MTIRQHYVLRDDLNNNDDDFICPYTGEKYGLTDIYIGSDESSPIFSFKGLEEYAELLRQRVSGMMPQDSNKRLAWLEDSNGKIVAEATMRTTILDKDFQKAIEDEEQAMIQEELGGLKDGVYSGKVVDISNGVMNSPAVVTQKVNREGDTVKHPAWIFKTIPNLGEIVDIQVKNGIASIQSKELNKGLSR